MPIWEYAIAFVGTVLLIAIGRTIGAMLARRDLRRFANRLERKLGEHGH
jgi:UPF0716 family protein affecting phage T7 exclusion